MSRSILISHPHAAAFSGGTAAGLERHGSLGLFVVGIGAAHGTWKAGVIEALASVAPIARNRVIRGVPPARLCSLGWLEAGARAFSRVASAVGMGGPSAYDAMFVSHDAAVAAIPWPTGTRAVYAYEDGALRTFRRAARLGIERIWDLPIPHYATLERMWVEEAVRWPGAMGMAPRLEAVWKKRRKDEELALASRISVPSTYVRESLEAVGVKVPIVLTPFGFPVEDFEPKSSPASGPFTVVAVGTQNLRKGTPYLLEAWKRAGLRNARLRLVGPMLLAQGFLSRYSGLFEHVPHIARTDLGEVYRSADLVALPTLGDGCPLVVQEAMSCGTPALTTRCGNGPDLITDGVDGWVVQERDVDVIVERLRAAAADRAKLHGMGQAARRRAEQWTWNDAGAALARAFSPQ